jgi:acyl carrier protein
MKPARTEILAAVVTILEEITADWNLDVEAIGPETRLAADLAFSSVDIMELMATVDVRFGRKLPYDRLVVKDGKYVEDLSVGQLVAFVDAHFEAEPPAVRPM